MNQVPHQDVKEKNPELSWEVFRLIATILTRFIKIRDECGISMSELYVLAYIKHFGKVNRVGEKLVLRGAVTQLLKREFAYTAKQVTTEVAKLRNKQCLREYTLESVERRAIYGASRGQKRAVVLLEEGNQKIELFTERINRVYEDLTGPLLAAAFSPDDKLSKSIAEWLLSEKEERTSSS